MSHLRVWPAGLGLLAILFAAPAPAENGPGRALEGRGDVLRIPGLPPIQLPPGVRAFGPGVVDEPEAPDARPRPGERAPAGRQADEERPEPKSGKRVGKAPDKIAPHSVPSLQDQRARLLDTLFGKLKAAQDEEEAKAFAAAIERVWQQSGSDTADLLLSRAQIAIVAHDKETAESLLDSIVEIEPGWTEGWHKRATIRFIAGDLDGAMADIDRVLKIEPRHFEALVGLGAILHKAGLDKRALEAYRRALDIYPKQPDIREAVEKLRIDVEGRDI